MLEKQPKLKWFLTEVAVGQMENIEAVGPRIYAWRLRPDGAEYVMDNVEMGDPTAKTYTYYQVGNRLKKILNPAVIQVIEKFHRITKGQHGDIHGNNILFVQRGPNVDVRIIDYGSWKSDDNSNGKLVGNKVWRLENGRLFRRNQNMINELFKTKPA